jgi:hypothetical protein
MTAIFTLYDQHDSIKISKKLDLSTKEKNIDL